MGRSRTTLEIDDALLEEALRDSPGKTKTAVVNEALREYVRARKRQALIDLIGSGVVDMTLEELLEWRGKARQLSDS